MINLLGLGSRYLLLILLFYFLYKIIRLIKKDLQQDLKAPSVTQREGRPKVSRKVEGNKNSVELVVLEGDGDKYPAGYALQLRKNITIGRGIANNIVLPDSAVSKQHAKIWEEHGQWWLADLGSKNGSLINGIPAEKHVALLNGDKIKFGDFVFQFVRWDNEIQ